MRVPRLVLPLLLAFALLAAPLAAAQDVSTIPLGDAGTARVLTLDGDATCDANVTASAELAPGAAGFLCVVFTPSTGANATRNLTATVTPPAALNFTNTSITFTLAVNATDAVAGGLPFTVADDVESDLAGESFDLPVELTLTNGTGGVVANASLLHVVVVETGELPPGPVDDGPSTILLLALAVLIAAAAVGGVAVLRRRSRVKVQPRSQALRQMEMERSLERAKKPEERAKVEAEIKAAEEERVLGREAQILQAKIDDLRGGLDRLRERFEAGQITQHQYERMKGRREAQLEELLRELDDTSGR